MNNPYRHLRLCAWSGPVLLVITIIFWGILGHNIPPFSADLTAQKFAAQFGASATQIRTGMAVEIAFSPLYLVWGLAITKVMETLETENNVLSTLQMWGAGTTTMIFIIPCAIWLTATFRADTLEPTTLQIVFDMGWMIFDLAFALTTVQMIAMGVCFLGDKRAVPLVPKWLAWFTMWVGFLFFCEVLNPFFKGGAFSRSGMLNYWIEFSCFFAFMLFVSIYILKAITRLEQERA